MHVQPNFDIIGKLERALNLEDCIPPLGGPSTKMPARDQGMTRMRISNFLGLAASCGALFLAACMSQSEKAKSPTLPPDDPGSVRGLKAGYDTLAGVVRLTWETPDAHSAAFTIHRAPLEGGKETLLGRVEETAWVDTAYPGDRAMGAHLRDSLAYGFRYTVRILPPDGEGPSPEASVAVTAVPPRLAIPFASLAWAHGGPDTASVRDTLVARFSYRNAGRGPKWVSWYRDTASQVLLTTPLDPETDFGTSVFAASWPDSGHGILRAVLLDTRGNLWPDSLRMRVEIDPPRADAGRDFDVLTNGPIRLAGYGEDRFGAIVKWEWKVGRDGDFRESATGDTTITAPADEESLPCVLRVTDDDGGIAEDTVWFSINKVIITSPRLNEMLPSRYMVEGRADPSVTVRVQVGVGPTVQAAGKGDWSVPIETGYLYPSDQTTLKITGTQGGEVVYQRRLAVRLAGDRPYWELAGGDGSYGSWDGAVSEMEEIRVLHEFQGRLYAALVSNAVDKKGQVWRFNGKAWELVGGSGVLGSWADGEVMSANALASDDRYLYAGTGIHQGMAYVWRFDGSAWERIGGDSLNGSWGSDLDCVWHLSMHGGELHAGLVGEDVGIQRAPMYRFDGENWHLITGEEGERNGWGRDDGYIMNYISVSSGADLYVGLAGRNPSSGKVFRYDGERFEQIGGEGLLGGWSNPAVKFVEDAIIHEGDLHVALQGTLDRGRREPPIWSLDGGAWRQVGDVPREWDNPGCYIYNKLHTFNGELYMGAGGRADATSMWKLRQDGTWAKIGGHGIAGSDWNTSGPQDHTLWVYTMATFQNELYIGLSSAETRGMAQVWRYRASR